MFTGPGSGGCELVPDTVVLELGGSAGGAKESTGREDPRAKDSTSREDPRAEEGSKVFLEAVNC